MNPDDDRPRKKARTSKSTKCEPDTVSNAAASNADEECAIDHSAFPHIMDAILDAAPPQSRWVLSQTCRALRDRFKVHVGGHVEVRGVRCSSRSEGGLVHLELQPYSAIPAPPVPNATEGKDTASGAPAAQSSPARNVMSILIPTPSLATSNVLRKKGEFREWIEANLTTDQLNWVANAKVAIVDIPHQAFALTDQEMLPLVMKPQIMRYPTSLRVDHLFSPDSVIHPVEMVPSQTLPLHHVKHYRYRSRVVFGLHYTTIPTVTTVTSASKTIDDGSGNTSARCVIHVSATLSANHENTVSSSDKALNFDNFKSLLRSLCEWAKDDVTIVGLERVASSLFGISAEDDNIPYTTVQELKKCYPDGIQVDRTSFGRSPPCVKILSETEYLKMRQTSPLMLAIERGARYHAT